MQKSLVTPNKTAMNMHLVHLGKILLRLSVVGICISLAAVLSAILMVFTYIIGFVLILLSLGSIFLLVPNYFDFLTSSGGLLATFGGFTMKIAIYVAPVSIVCGIAAIILLLFDKDQRHTVLSVIGSVVVLIAIATFIVLLGGV